MTVLHPDVADMALDHGGDTPFLRPSRRPRPRRGRRGLLGKALLAVQGLGVVALALAIGWVGMHRVLRSERLKVSRVDVRGGHFLSDGEVRELLGPAVGENILTIDIAALKERLRASPWVSEATVERTLPNTLRVDVTERVPLALAEMDRLYLMDAQGELIDIYGPRTATFDLPVVRGLAAVPADARHARAQQAGALLFDLGDLGVHVSEVRVLDSRDLEVVLRGSGKGSEVVLLGPEPPYRQRVLAFLRLRDDLVARTPNALAFDLRFRDHVYVRLPDEPPPPPPVVTRVAQAPAPVAARPPAPAPKPSAPAAVPEKPVLSAPASVPPSAAPSIAPSSSGESQPEPFDLPPAGGEGSADAHGRSAVPKPEARPVSGTEGGEQPIAPQRTQEGR